MKNYLASTLSPLLSLGFLTLACGDTEEQQIVKRFFYDVRDHSTLDLAVEFSQDIELNTDVIIPIREYGELRLISSDVDHGFSLGGSLNLSAFVDEELVSLERTRRLPNEQPMSSYIATDVARLRVKAHEQVATSIYLGIDPNQLYLGTAIELTFMGKDFPAGLVISQRIRDSQKRMLGVITIYGPEVKNDKVIHPGGIFFMTNVTDLIAYKKASQGKVNSLGDKLTFEDSTYISENHRKELSSKKNVRRLLDLFRKRGQEVGLID